jgi:energy-converting hydrogenase Eha subunit F
MWWLGLGFSLAAEALWGQVAPPGAPSVQAVRIATPPVIDGKLDDPVWQQGFLIKDFTQFEPDAGKPATERTEARIAFDSQNIYFGIRCYDSQPDRIVDNAMRRDTDLTFEDSIQIILDTFHDRSNGYIFMVSPAGAQADGLVRREGEGVSYEWDGVWQAAAARDAEGWTAEIAIPFKTLRFPKTEPQTWGFNMRRFVAHRTEDSYWAPLKRENGVVGRYKISDFGTIEGLQGITTGAGFQLIPYALTRFRKDDRTGDSTVGSAGGDFKASLTSNLVVDVTVHTDFAEAEADLQQINFGPYKLLYPEKRQFFLEGSNIFFFGDRGQNFNDPDTFQLFFSRQIGLTQDGRQAIPVLGGAKLTGTLDSGLDIGFLNLTTEDLSFRAAGGSRAFEPQTNYTVLRLRKSLGAGSSIGLIGLNKDPQGPAYNRAAGLDWDFAFTPKLSSAGFLSRSETPGLNGKDYAGSADLLYRSELFRVRTSLTDIGDNFNPEIGYTTRIGVKKSQTELTTFFHPDWGPIHLIPTINDFNYVRDQSGRLISQWWLREIVLVNQQRAGLAILSYDKIEVLKEPLVLHKGVVIPPGEYRFQNLFLGLGTDFSKPLSCLLWYDNGQYYDGTRLRTLLTLLIRPVRGLTSSWTYDRNRIETPHGNFTTDLVYADIAYSLTTNLLVRGLVQWNKEDNFGANVAITWSRPGTDYFLIYNDVQDLDLDRREDGQSPLLPGRSFILKVRHRFDF